MAEYLAVEYDGIFNRYKQNTEYLEAPVEEFVVDVVALQTEAQLTEVTASSLSYQAVLAQQSLNTAIASSIPENIATAQLALDEADRLAQEAEEAKALAEVELNKSFIDKLYFYTLDCDINKKNKPLNFITKYTPVQITTFKAEEKQLIKVDKYGNHSTFGVTSDAPYDANTNMWNIDGQNNVSFDNEPLINGGAFTIIFLYQRNSENTINSNEEFVSFITDSNVSYFDDILLRRSGVGNGFIVKAGRITWTYYGLLWGRANDKLHMAVVIVPNEGVKVYIDGYERIADIVSTTYRGDIPAKIYNYQNLGGTNSKVKGLLGNFRFYNRALSSDEIATIGSIGATYNDLFTFNIRPIYFKAEENQLIKVDKYGNYSTFDVTSDAPYNYTTNMWDIGGQNNISIGNEQLIDGEAFTIMYLYKSTNNVTSWEEFVSFTNNNTSFNVDDIYIRRQGTTDTIAVRAGGLTEYFSSAIGNNTLRHFTFVIVPNGEIKYYRNGINVPKNPSTTIVGNISEQIYTYQNIGGTRVLANGSIGNFRFYNRELSSAEILAIGSIGTTSNDLVPFEIISSYFSETNVYNFIGKNPNQNELVNIGDGLVDIGDGLVDIGDGLVNIGDGLGTIGGGINELTPLNDIYNTLLTKISSYGNLHTIGTFANGSDDRIKSHEVEIENATETLLKLTPKTYEKHPSVRFHEDQEENDLTNIPHFKESGLVAQEVLKDAPELDHIVVKPKTDEDLYGMNYIGLIPYLIKSNKELYENIISHRNKINEKKNKS